LKSQTKNLVWKFAIIAVGVMALYNFFGNYLTAVEVIPVNAWFIAPFPFIAPINCCYARLSTGNGGKKIIHMLRSLWDSLSFSITHFRSTTLRGFF